MIDLNAIERDALPAFVLAALVDRASIDPDQSPR
jgi:hypothetical protein